MVLASTTGLTVGDMMVGGKEANNTASEHIPTSKRGRSSMDYGKMEDV
jgi:hypothetical protein